jgi:hypothetical protein
VTIGTKLTHIGDHDRDRRHFRFLQFGYIDVGAAPACLLQVDQYWPGARTSTNDRFRASDPRAPRTGRSPDSLPCAVRSSRARSFPPTCRRGASSDNFALLNSA